MSNNSYDEIDSKFRFVIVAAKRAKQLLRGAKPKIKSKSKNLIRVAQEEVEQGLIDFRIIHPDVEEVIETEDDIFIGEDLVGAPDILGEVVSIPDEPEEENQS